MIRLFHIVILIGLLISSCSDEEIQGDRFTLEELTGDAWKVDELIFNGETIKISSDSGTSFNTLHFSEDSTFLFNSNANSFEGDYQLEQTTGKISMKITKQLTLALGGMTEENQLTIINNSHKIFSDQDYLVVASKNGKIKLNKY